jgi:hypothetical protein
MVLRLSRFSVITYLGCIFAASCIVPLAFARFGLIRQPLIDIPVSLAKGKVRTREFGSKQSETYLILIRAQRGPIPFADMNCMMGVSWGVTSSLSCNLNPLLKADWWVYDTGQCVAAGAIIESGGGGTSNRDLDRYLGNFSGQAGHKYVLEVLFLADGTPLNVAKPHLVVEIKKPWD